MRGGPVSGTVCACGCGQSLRAPRKGSHNPRRDAAVRFISGHNNRDSRPVLERIRARSKWVGQCLVWQGKLNGKGYGVFGSAIDGRSVFVHRIAYEAVYGVIPAGMEIDHVRSRGCESRACVNLDHLQAVTHRENVGRAWEWRAKKQSAREETYDAALKDGANRLN
jgi:hypothetical protein